MGDTKILSFLSSLDLASPETAYLYVLYRLLTACCFFVLLVLTLGGFCFFMVYRMQRIHNIAIKKMPRCTSGKCKFFFFLIPIFCLRTFLFSFSLRRCSSNSDPGSLGGLFSPLPTTVRAFIFIVRILQPFRPSSTRIELGLGLGLLGIEPFWDCREKKCRNGGTAGRFQRPGLTKHGSRGRGCVRTSVEDSSSLGERRLLHYRG